MCLRAYFGFHVLHSLATHDVMRTSTGTDVRHEEIDHAYFAGFGQPLHLSYS